MISEDIAKTAEHWDQYNAQRDPPRALWLAHPLIQERLTVLRDGRSLDDWFVQEWAPPKPLDRGIGIGAGVSMLELLLVKCGIVSTYDLYDVSQAALDIARETAQTFGVEDRVNCKIPFHSSCGVA